MGYKILALNTSVNSQNFISSAKKTGKKRKYQETSASAPQPQFIPVPENFRWINEVKEKGSDVQILQRITIAFADVATLQKAVRIFFLEITQDTCMRYLVCVLTSP